MFHYNKLLELVDIEDDTDGQDDNDLNEEHDNLLIVENNKYKYDIQSKHDLDEIPDNHTTILDTIIRHPFMENKFIDVNKQTTSREKISLIIYRIGIYGINKVVEFYLIDDFLSIQLELGDNMKTIVLDTLKYIPGDKRIKGGIDFESTRFILVQVRDNTDASNWINIWDIISNKHYFGDTFTEDVINFFTTNIEISNLLLHKRICMKPIVLYSCIDKCHSEYITKNKSIQYCQRDNDPLIRLNSYNRGDNIRTICFIEDKKFSDTYTDLLTCDYIIMNRPNEQLAIDIDNIWIFKNETHIFSYIK
jgi:hypothetical protein